MLGYLKRYKKFLTFFIGEPDDLILFNPLARHNELLKVISKILQKGIDVGNSLKCARILAILQNNPHYPAIQGVLTDLGFIWD